MRYILLLFACSLPCILWAQRPGQTTDRSGKAAIGIEVQGGANLVINRKPLNDLFARRATRAGIAPQVGINFVLIPAEELNLIFGVDYIYDRARLLGYTKSSVLQSIPNLPDIEQRREGEVSIEEHFLRFRAEARLRFDRLTFTPGIALSSYLNGRQRYDYTQTTSGFYDFETGTFVLFDTPISDRGSNIIDDDALTGYLSLLVGVGYQLTDRLGVYTSIDFGLSISAGNTAREIRQSRDRVSVGLTYSLLQQ